MDIKRYELNDDIFAFVDKVNINDGDTLVFYVKTDDQGYPFQDLDLLNLTFRYLQDYFKNRGVTIFVLFDKYYLEAIVGVENGVIEDLEKLKSKIEETIAEIKRAREPDSEIS